MKAAVSKYYCFIPLLLLCSFYAYKAINFPIHDFSNYYFGGKFLAEGSFNSDVYFPYSFNKAIAALGYQGVFASYAPNTPFLAFFFLPFSVVSVAIAKLVFNLISIVLFLVSIYRLFSFYKINPKAVFLIPVLFFVPIKNDLLFGQVYFLLFFLLAEGWLAYEKKHWNLTGLFWGLAILLKVFPMLLVFFLLFKRQGKILLYVLFFSISLLGISLFFTGTDIWGFYLKEVLPKASNGEIANSFVDNYQSVFMFFKRCFVYETVENPKPFSNGQGYFPAFILAFKIGMLSLGFFVSKRKDDVFFIFSFWILAMLLFSPYGSTYGLILLVFPFLALLHSNISNGKKAVFGTIIFFICNVPLSFFIDKPLPVSYLRLFLLLALFVGFVLFKLKKTRVFMAFALACATFIIATFFKQDPPIQSEALSIGGSPILIYDYQIKNSKLVYFYWNEKGENKDSITYKAVSAVPIQITAGFRRFTNEKGNKSKPLLIDSKTILFLSDYDRGIGFYTLRNINIR